MLSLLLALAHAGVFTFLLMAVGALWAVFILVEVGYGQRLNHSGKKMLAKSMDAEAALDMLRRRFDLLWPQVEARYSEEVETFRRVSGKDKPGVYLSAFVGDAHATRDGNIHISKDVITLLRAGNGLDFVLAHEIGHTVLHGAQKDGGLMLVYMGGAWAALVLFATAMILPMLSLAFWSLAVLLVFVAIHLPAIARNSVYRRWEWQADAFAQGVCPKTAGIGMRRFTKLMPGTREPWLYRVSPMRWYDSHPAWSARLRRMHKGLFGRKR